MGLLQWSPSDVIGDDGKDFSLRDCDEVRIAIACLKISKVAQDGDLSAELSKYGGEELIII